MRNRIQKAFLVVLAATTFFGESLVIVQHILGNIAIKVLITRKTTKHY